MSATTLDTQVVTNAVKLACRAPSLCNSQPWMWEYRSGRLHLFLDPSRVMDSDRSGREALISCGAVLDHLRVTMAAASWCADINRFPEAHDPNHLASIRLTPMDHMSEDQRRRADAILARHTDRLPLMAPTNWEMFEPMLRGAVDGSKVYLEVMSRDVHAQLAEASQLANSLRLYDTPYHQELAWWIAPFEVSEGIPYSSLVSAAESERVDVGRLLPLAGHGDRRPGVPEDHSRVVVLSTEGDDRADALASGEALSAVLLECTIAGLATCTVTHITEVEASRELIRALLDHEAMPQVLVRVGVAPAMEELPPPTPRRPVEEVLRIAG
jgi:nitroreductase